jgi:hypothetical protein
MVAISPICDSVPAGHQAQERAINRHQQLPAHVLVPPSSFSWSPSLTQRLKTFLFLALVEAKPDSAAEARKDFPGNNRYYTPHMHSARAARLRQYARMHECGLQCGTCVIIYSWSPTFTTAPLAFPHRFPADSRTYSRNCLHTYPVIARNVIPPP